MKCYYLSTCSTCNRILTELGRDNFQLQDIKTEKITEKQLDEMIQLAGSAEALFSRRGMKYKSMGLAKKELTEQDYKNLILDEYTFLSRPVFIDDSTIFIGNAASTIESLKKTL